MTVKFTTEANNNEFVITTSTSTTVKSTPISGVLSSGNVGSANATSETLSIEKTKNNAEINKLKQEIETKCSLLGVTSKQLFSTFSQNILQEEYLTVEICKKRLEALNAAIKDATKNGKLDKEKAIELAKDYVIALNTRWSIEGIKKQNQKCGEKSLRKRLIEAGFLKNKNGNESPEELEKAAEIFFKKFFIGKLSDAKTEKEKNKIITEQLQTFGRILINTKGEDRTVIVKAVKNLFQENRVEGTKNLFISAISDEQKHEMAAKLRAEMPEIAEGLSDDALVQIESLRVINLSAEDKKQLPEEVKAEWNQFCQKFSEKDREVVANYYQNRCSIDDVPENYKEAFKEYTYLVNKMSGDKIGLVPRDAALTETEQFDVNKNLDTNIQSFGDAAYNAVQNKTAEIVDKHPEILNMSREEVVSYLDKVSDGKFSAIAKESNVAPNLFKGDAASKSGVGLEQNTTKENCWTTMAAIDTKLQKLYEEDKKEAKVPFIVERDSQTSNKTPFEKFQTLKGLSSKDILDGLANRYIKIGDVLDKYNDLTQSAKDFLNKFIESMSTGIQNYLLNGLKDNVVLTIAKHTSIDLSKLNLSSLTYDARKEVERIQDERNRETKVNS